MWGIGKEKKKKKKSDQLFKKLKQFKSKFQTRIRWMNICKVK